MYTYAGLFALRLSLTSCLICYELLLHLVWVHASRLFLVCFIDILLICIGFDAEEIIECDIWAFRGCDFVA